MQKIKLDVEGRAVLALQVESRRMSEAAERVRLVVQAMALRRGICPREVTEQDVDLLA